MSDQQPTFPSSPLPKTGSIMSGVRLRHKTPFGNLHVVIVIDMKTDKEVEVFAQLGKSGSITSADLEGLCRLSSIYLRRGGPLTDIVKQLKGIATELARTKGEVVSIPDSLGCALQRYLDYKKAHGAAKLVLGEVTIDEPDEGEEKDGAVGMQQGQGGAGHGDHHEGQPGDRVGPTP